MAKQQDNNNEMEFIYLKKDKTEFDAVLSGRISAGESLLAKPITTLEELIERANEFDLWHALNREIIERAFDRPNNNYYRDYIYVHKPHRVEQLYGQMKPQPPSSLEDGIDLLFKEVRDRMKRLLKLKTKLPAIDVLPSVKAKLDVQEQALENLTKLLASFHKVAQGIRNRHKDKKIERSTLEVNDEYDVQDLLKGLLRIFFTDVREENFVSSFAGANSRIDFVFKNEKIVLETKMTSATLRDKELGDQLLIDIGRYETHPSCEILVIFIYDRGDFIKNKSGLINDLESKISEKLKVKVIINPL